MAKDFLHSSFDFMDLEPRDLCGLDAFGGLEVCAQVPFEAPAHEDTQPASPARYWTGKMADPATWPAHLVLSVRAFTVTEITLQRLCASVGLTFWGEAVHQVLAFCARNPDQVDLENLRDVPAALFRPGRRRGKNTAAAPSRGIMTPLSGEVDAWVRSLATQNRMSRAKCASAILHRNAKPVAAAIRGEV